MLEQFMREARSSIEQGLPLFIESFKGSFTHEELNQLRSALAEKHPLNRVRNMLHNAMVRNMRSGIFDTTPFWAVEDAINFLLDVETKRWPYATEDTHFRYLTWSLEHMSEALAACAVRAEP